MKNAVSAQLFIILFCTFLISACSDEGQNPEIDLELKSMSEAQNFESDLGSKELGTSDANIAKGFVPGYKGNPLKTKAVFVRSESGFVPLVVKYYTPDDKVQLVVYEWNKVLPGTTPEDREKILVEEAGKYDSYHQEYAARVKQFIEKYGDPSEGDGKMHKSGDVFETNKAHLGWVKGNLKIDLDWIWISSNQIRVIKIIAKSYPLS